MTRTRAEIEAWLCAAVAQVLGVRADTIDIDRALVDYGVSSRDAVALSGDLADWLGRDVEPTIAWDHPSLRAIAAALSGETPLRQAPALLARGEPIAIVGIGCRFPGMVGAGPAAFWRMLSDGRDGVSDGAFGRGGYLQDSDRFDAERFGIGKREAAAMDPQQRVLLDCVEEALADAALAPVALRGSHTGVFVGISNNDYGRIGAAPEVFLTTGNAFSIAANRLSYVFDWRGPSLAVDTACSSSLVAVHLAAQSLKSGECTRAIAAGVNLILSSVVSESFSGLLSRSGRCKSFDQDADGYVRSEGVGAVVLMPLSQAIADRHTIYACIQGSAVNQDGRTNGLTAPNRQAQEEVIARALSVSGVAGADIAYVEAHGSATALGDRIETQALSFVLGQARGTPCFIGSVKSNVGHMESAAGIAGLIKTALILQHGEIAPSLHCATPKVAAGLEVARTRTAFAPGAFAGVSAFGFGGTNAHCVLARAPVQQESECVQRPWELLAVSARTRVGCDAALAAIRENESVARLAYTLAVGRGEARERAVVVAPRDGASERRVIRGSAAQREVVFLFPGLGEGLRGMGQELYDTEPAYRQAFDGCAERLLPLLGEDIRLLLKDADPERLQRTRLAHPIVFAIAWSLAEALRAHGVVPAAVLGHSLGEYVAAAVSGALTLDDALLLVSTRAQLIDAQPEGAMLAIAAPAEKVAPLLPDGVSLSAFNAPAFVVVSGPAPAIETLEARLKTALLAGRRLPVTHAFHTPLLAAVAPAFAEVLKRVKAATPRVPMLSNLDGAWLRRAPDAAYWQAHLVSPVAFSAAAETLAASIPEPLLVEVGPGLNLAAFVLQHGVRAPAPVAMLRHFQDAASDAQVFVSALARLWCEGVPVDLKARAEASPALRMSLPPLAEAPAPRHWLAPASPYWAQRFVQDDAPAPSAASGTWLVLGDAALACALAERGATVFERISDCETTPRAIVVCEPEYDRFIATAQAIVARWFDADLQVALVAPGLSDDPARALLLGPCRVLGQEYPRIRTRAIERGPDTRNDALVDELLREETALVRLGAVRAVEHYEALPMLPPARLRQRGVYLIFGGGAIGQALCAWLVAQFSATVVVVSESTGTDIADEVAVRRALDDTRARHGAVHGVFHAAGRVGQEWLRGLPELGREHSDWHFYAKVNGVQALAAALSGVDFCLLVSSISSQLGGIGFSAYAAANLYMDAFAKTQPGWRSLCWDGAQPLSRLPEAVLQCLAFDPMSVSTLVVSHAAIAERRAEQPKSPSSAPVRRATYVAPSTDAEVALVRFCTELLGIERIGVDDDFFHLGGNSLMGTQLIARIRRHFSTDVPLRTLFEARTPRTLALAVEERVLSDIEALAEGE